MGRKTKAQLKAEAEAAQQAEHDATPVAASPIAVSEPPKAPVDTKVENLDAEPEAAHPANGGSPTPDA